MIQQDGAVPPVLGQACGPAPFPDAHPLRRVLVAGPFAALVLRPEGDGAAIDAVGPDGVAALSLGPFHEDDVVALWRSLAAQTGSPLAFAGPDGRLCFPVPQLGRLRVGPACPRRRMAVLNGRRPRFLARRKAARLPRRPLVHREPEIACGRGA